ncbi:RCC2 protein [Spatholobus suberectus]|nr:RCC2 protein [Spatholobus suberectus]
MSALKAEKKVEEEKEKVKGGELLFCGATCWDIIGRRTGAVDGNLVSPSRLRPLVGVDIRYVASSCRRCYTWGRNEGQLGHGDTIQCDKPTVVSELSNLRICLCGDNSSNGDDNNDGSGGGNADDDGCGGADGSGCSSTGGDRGGAGGDRGGASGDGGGIVSGGGDIACGGGSNASGHDRGRGRGRGRGGGVDDGSGDEACGGGSNYGGRGSCGSSDGW